MPEYYECPVCYMMQEELLECPSCTTRACKGCSLDYSKHEHLKNPASKAQGFMKCTICHKFLVQKPMHKFLSKLLNELKFRCPDCKRAWPYEKYKTHKQRDECHPGAEEEDQVMSFFQPNAVAGGDLIKSLFVFERDSKNIHEYIF